MAFNRLRLELATAPVLQFPRYDCPFIIDTDASNVSLGAVLSNFIDGVELLIVFASRSLSKTETMYSTTKREALAVVQALKWFRHYRWGLSFVICTEHASLKWLFRQNADGMTFRMLQRLQEFNYEIVHRAGNKHANADGLSRMTEEEPECELGEKEQVTGLCPEPQEIEEARKSVRERCAMVDAITKTIDDGNEEGVAIKWTRTDSDIERLQQEDEAISRILYWTPTGSESSCSPLGPNLIPKKRAVQHGPEVVAYWSRWSEHVLKNRVLFRKWFQPEKNEPHLQLIVPVSCRKEILDQLHTSPVSGGHFKVEKTLMRIRQRFWWPFMRRGIENKLSWCLPCAVRTTAGRQRTAELSPFKVGIRFHTVAADILGPVTLAARSRAKYILVMTDLFTKYAISVSLVVTEAKDVAKETVERWVLHFGVPDVLHTDQGKNFGSGLIKELCKLFKMDKTRTSPYHPQGNGQVERHNRVIADVLSKYCAENPQDWDTMLPYVNFVYNTTIHRTTGATPFSLVYGQECQYPIDLFYPKPHDQKRTQNKFVDWLDRQFREAHSHARELLGVNRNRQKDQFHKNILENHTKSMTKFGFSQNIKLKQKNSFFRGRDRTLSLRELRKLITKLVKPKGVINGVSSATKYIVFASRSLSKTETMYSTTKREALAVVQALKWFRHYRWGLSFVICTEHASLKWLFRQNADGMTFRMLQRLQEFNYEIVHRAGNKHANADGLSRMTEEEPECELGEKEQVTGLCPEPQEIEEARKSVRERCAMVDAITKTIDDGNEEGVAIKWTRTDSDIERLQQEDEAISRILYWTPTGSESSCSPLGPNLIPKKRAVQHGPEVVAYWSRWSELVLKNRVLFRKWFQPEKNEPHLQLIVPVSCRKEILDQLHTSPVSGGHFKVEKTLMRIRQRFWWPFMRRGIENKLSWCLPCAVRTTAGRQRTAELSPFKVGIRFHTVAADILGPVTLAARSRAKYILVMTDLFTKYAISVSLVVTEAKDVAKETVERWVLHFGVPDVLHTDQGKNFGSGLIKELCKLFKMDKTRTSPYHPQGNGQVERHNRVIADVLSKYCAENPQDWDTMLPYVNFVYNTTIHRTTGATPFSLVYGQECQYPIDLFYPKPHDQKRTQNEFVDWLDRQFREAHSHARELLGVNRNRQKDQFHKNILENHTKSMTKFGFSQNIKLKQKNSFFRGRDRTLSLRELRKLITKLVKPKGVINGVSSTTISSNHSWKRNRKRASVEPPRFVRRIFTRNHWKLTSGSNWIQTPFPGRKNWCQEIGFKSRSLPWNKKTE